MKNNIEKITNYLDELYPNPKCELVYNKDYELLISTMLSAQTTDKRVNEVTKVLYKKYPNLESLSKANINDLKEIIKPIGTYNIKARNVIIIAEKLKQINYVPNDYEFLKTLPGIGRKTINVVLSNLYDIPCIAVDTHVKRVSIRLNLAQKNDTPIIIEEKLSKIFKKEIHKKIHLQFVLFGRYHCKAKKPNCSSCKLKDICNEVKLNKF